MTAPAPAPAKTPGRASMLLPLIVDFGLPLAVYYGLRAAGVDQWWALLFSGVVPAVAVIVRLVRSRTVDFLALFVLSIVALSLGISAMTGDARTERMAEHVLADEREMAERLWGSFDAALGAWLVPQEVLA